MKPRDIGLQYEGQRIVLDSSRGFNKTLEHEDCQKIIKRIGTSIGSKRSMSQFSVLKRVSDVILQLQNANSYKHVLAEDAYKPNNSFYDSMKRKEKLERTFNVNKGTIFYDTTANSTAIDLKGPRSKIRVKYQQGQDSSRRNS